MDARGLLLGTTLAIATAWAAQANAQADVTVIAQKRSTVGGAMSLRDDADNPLRAESRRTLTNTYTVTNASAGCGTPLCTVTGFADAAAYADLSTGRIGASALAEGLNINPGTGGGGAGGGIEFSAVAVGRLTDVLKFDLVNSTDRTFIPFSIDIDGELQGFNSLRRQDGSFAYVLTVSESGSGRTNNLTLRGEQTFGDPFRVASNTIAAGTGSLSRFDATGLTGGFFVSEGRDYRIRFELVVEDNADFYHTGAFSFDLPLGVTFTSASGNFLTNAGSNAVPEPGAWALLIVGFASAGAALRRHRTFRVS
jgi:hypothetical protein